MENNKDNFQFKDFIYLNTNFLESFIAQKYKGFPKEMQAIRILESSDEKIGEKSNSEDSINGKIGTGLFGAEGNATTITEGMQFNQNNTETAQNVVVKVQKDNMYNSFFTYLQHNDLLTDTTNPDIEMYIRLHDTFYYVDFDRIQKLCDENYRCTYQSYDNNSTEFSFERFDEIRNKITLLKELIPFDALLCNNDYIVLLDQIWLRNKKEHLGYLLGGKINIVGKVSKALQTDNEMPDVIRILNMIQQCTLSMLHDLGFCVSDKVYIISPIAIYH